MRVLFAGDLSEGGTTLQRMNALRDLGYAVEGVQVGVPSRRFGGSLAARAISRAFRRIAVRNSEQRLHSLARRNRYDIFWSDKAVLLSSDSLRTIRDSTPGMRLVFYSPDDMTLKGNQTPAYLACIPLFDLHITTKSYLVSELSRQGARAVAFVDNGYDPHTHRPIPLSHEERSALGCGVGFVGGFERERFETMRALAETGFDVTVRGPGWERVRESHQRLHLTPGWVLGDDYARAVCATKINLCFLRKAARDLQTQRSVEIPACGGFMLAERSEEHAKLFKEGEEAVFFSTVEELRDKIRYYLAHAEEREKIAEAGRRRCEQGRYRYQDRIAQALEGLNEDPQ